MQFLVFLIALTLQSYLQLPSAQAAIAPVQGSTRKLMQTGGDETTFDRKNHLTKLKGNAFIYRENEVVRADYIEFESGSEKVHAEGRVQYQYADYYIRADSIDLDLRSKTGTVINGNLSNGQFALRGSKIEQLELGHFLVTDYTYSTCHDCPNSWEMTGGKGDFTIDGYAVMHDFIFKVKDAAIFYVPLMVLPIKTKRQSGFLFPRFGTNQVYGSFFVEPYYWAINRWSDFTAGAGLYSKNGERFEGEARYALTERSQGTANVYWSRDKSVPGLTYRHAIKTALTQELPYEIEAKLRINEVSDSGYPVTYADDIAGRYEPVLASDLFFSRNDPELSTTVSFRRIRNLLNFNGQDFVSNFDGQTVQEFPRIVVNSNDRFVFGQKFAFGVETRFSRFTRGAGAFDSVINPKDNSVIQTIREANRFTLVPNLYTTLNPFPWLSVVPSLQYRSFFYNFNGTPGYPNLIKGYLLAQAEMSLQLEKFFATQDPAITYKHTIRPTLTYSLIPTIQQPETHPFLEQQKNALSGLYFDNSDIVPEKTTQNLDSYFVPLGNSVTYGLVTQVFKKQKRPDGSTTAERSFEAGITQTLDLLEARKALDNTEVDNRIILSPLFAHFIYQTGSFYSAIDYTYFSFLDRYIGYKQRFDHLPGGFLDYPNPHRFSASVAWTLEHAVKQGVLTFDRSMYLNYTFSKLTSRVSSLQLGGNFSINDYIMPKASVSYNLASGAPYHLLEYATSVVLQNPSKCWQIEIGKTYSIDRQSAVIFSFALNMTGNSFGALDDPLKK